MKEKDGYCTTGVAITDHDTDRYMPTVKDKSLIGRPFLPKHENVTTVIRVVYLQKSLQKTLFGVLFSINLDCMMRSVCCSNFMILWQE